VSARHALHVHGLRVVSDLALPEFADLAVRDAVVPDAAQVRIRRRDVPRLPDDPSGHWWYVRADGTAIVDVSGVAMFAVRSGRDIDVDAASGADPAEVRAFLIGPVLSVLLHQRGELPLHISAVVLDGRAWAFTAPAGTGKSTLAAALHLHAGLPLVTDDVGVVRAAADGTGSVWLWPGPPLIKLRADAFADVAEVAPPSMPEYARSQKARLRVPDEHTSGPVRLAGMILLRRAPAAAAPSAEVLDVRRVRGAEAFFTAQSAVHRLAHGVQATSVATMFARVAWLASAVPCHVGTLSIAERPATPERAQAVVGALAELSRAGAR
jgi:hypothetical protein